MSVVLNIFVLVLVIVLALIKGVELYTRRWRANELQGQEPPADRNFMLSLLLLSTSSVQRRPALQGA